jgi:cellulose 1,4-beta-cellobiosidase
MSTGLVARSAARLALTALLALTACADGVVPDGPDPAPAASGSGGSSSAAGGNGSSGGAGAASGGAGAAAGGGSSAGGSGGLPGTGGAPAGLSVSYQCAAPETIAQQLRASLNIHNGGDAAVDLAELTVRYWFTAEGAAAGQAFECDYAVIGEDNVSGTFADASGTDADTYLEISFAGATTLAPGAESGEIQARFYKTDFSDYDQSNDWSFDPTKTAPAPWDRVTLHHGGALLWGTEP